MIRSEPVEARPPTPAPVPDLPYGINGRAAKPSPWVWVVVLVLVAAAGVAAWLLLPRLLHRDKTNGAGGLQTGQRTVPVVVATAVKGDMNQYLVGLGTVTPLNTVTVKS